MIVMRVRRDGDERPLEQVFLGIMQARNAHAGINEEVGVATPHMPNIAAAYRVDMGFPQDRDVVVNAFAFEPAVSETKSHAVRPNMAAAFPKTRAPRATTTALSHKLCS